MANLPRFEVTDVAPIKDGYRLKVNFPDLDFYVWGFRATRSDKNPSGWWIQGPATHIEKTNEWKPNPEFGKKNPFWMEIEESCINAVESYDPEPNVVYSPKDSELTDEAIEKALDESINRFGLENERGKAIPWINEG